MGKVSLKEYFEAKIASLDKATILALFNLDKRLDSMNEFRAALKDQTSNSVPRTEFENVVSKMDMDIRVLRENKASQEGRASQQSVTIAYVIAVISIIISIISILMRFIV